MGTHPIFESDFDCLTEFTLPLFTMVKFDDVSKKADDLFKKPFNAGKTNVDIKAAGFVLKNSSKDGAMTSNVEMKISDALMGLANEFKPCLVVHTDLTKYDMSYHMSGDSHQLALKYGWMMGSDHSNFAVAAKKTLANGADFHIKSDLSGITEIAHVSNISVGEFNSVKCTVGSRFRRRFRVLPLTRHPNLQKTTITYFDYTHEGRRQLASRRVLSDFGFIIRLFKVQ